MKKLLHLLHEDARLTNAQLAVMLNTSEEAVANAIAEYEEAGIIRGYKAIVNWEKVDSSPNKVTALIELKVTPKRETGFDTIAHRIMEFKEVESVYLMSGGFDLAVMVHGSSMQEIAMFVAKRLSTLETVLSTSTHFVLSRYKEGDVVLNSEIPDDRREYGE